LQTPCETACVRSWLRDLILYPRPVQYVEVNRTSRNRLLHQPVVGYLRKRGSAKSLRLDCQMLSHRSPQSIGRLTGKRLYRPVPAHKHR
jgi:hypothetical protein